MMVIDFETRSLCDLKTAGTYLYVSDSSTDIICMAAHDIPSGDEWLWFAGEPLPAGLADALAQADFIAAHNAEFDQGIYEYVAVAEYGFPDLHPDKWYCTSAQCRVNALPAGLDDAAWALGLTNRKHSSGANLIRLLSIPNPDGSFNEDEAARLDMGAYCLQDVRVTVDVVNHTRLMTQQEHIDWLKTSRMNETGIKVDTEMAELALGYASDEQAEIGQRLAELTDGEVTKHTQGERVKKLLVKQLGELHPAVKMMTVYKDGKAKFSLDKNIRRNLLLMPEQEGGIPDKFLEIIELVDDGNKSSVAKFKRMLERSGSDDRIRGAFVFAGAGQTLRYASRGLQLHNMRRECWSSAEAEIIKDMMRRKALLRSHDGALLGVMDTLSKLLRPALIPEKGFVFVVSDWSSIEARCLHYLCDTDAGRDKLDLFASGADVYTAAANAMGFEDRQIGKVAELACGYQGARKALQNMARNYGVPMDDNLANRVVAAWRSANWWIVDFWHQLEKAAKQAIQFPGERVQAGRVSYVFLPDLIDGTLMCIMPGNNMIQYPRARIESVDTPFGQTYSVTALKSGYRPKADAKEWPRGSLYGGLFCENICQGFAAALLRNALRGLDDVVAHVHDELVMEVPTSLAEDTLRVLSSTMAVAPDWAAGLPLNVEPAVMVRYGK